MQNGIPWWYFFYTAARTKARSCAASIREGKSRRGHRTATGRRLRDLLLDRDRRAGRHQTHRRHALQFRRRRPRRRAAHRTHRGGVVAGGLKAPVEADIRADIWLKFLGNAAFNPISALTRATLVEMTDDPRVEPMVAEMMSEASRSRTPSTSRFPSRSRSESTARAASARTRPRCCRTSKRASRWNSTPSRAPSSNSAALTGTPTPATEHVYALTKLLEKSILAGR